LNSIIFRGDIPPQNENLGKPGCRRGGLGSLGGKQAVILLANHPNYQKMVLMLLRTLCI